MLYSTNIKLTFLNTWHSKLHEPLRDYVRDARENTDVFCFQEAEAETQSAYNDLLAEYNRYHHEKAQRNLFLANVIFVRKDITVLESGRLLHEGSNIGFANFVTLQNDEGETSVCNVHGIPHPAHKLDNPERLAQSQAIIDHFKARERVIIGGDFNMLPQAQSIKAFKKHGYQDLIGDYDIQSTRNHIALDAYPDNPQYHTDYVFVSPDIQVTGFAVPSAVISDHQPLELQIA